MAGITKNFIVKNGLEVNGGLFIVNTDNNKVGVGTTVLSHDFNVKGGIGVTNAVVSGIATVNEFQSTHSQLGIATASIYRVGTTTVFETSGGLVSLSGIQTVDSTAKTTLINQLLGGQVDINNLYVTGVATFLNLAEISGSLYVAGQSDFDDIYVAGISTFVGVSTYQSTLFGTQLSVSGVSTLSSAIVGSAVTITSGGIDVTGVVTSTSAIVGSAVTLTSGGINLTGIGTIRNINSTQINSTDVNVSGVTTAASLNVTGSSTLSSAIVGSAVTITSGGINATGVSTFATYLKIDNVNLGGGLFAGIITAANGGQPVVYYGDGSNLSNVNAAPNLGISTAGGFVGSGVTLLNFRGSGVSTVFTNFTAGIGTIFIEGGTVTPGGSNTQVQFNNSGVLGGSSNFVFDGSRVGIGTTILVNTLQVGGGIGATTLNITGVSTLGITTVSQLNVSGVSTFGNVNVNNSTTELSSIVNIRKAAGGNLTAEFSSGGQATLYYDGTQRLQTSSVGAVVNGDFTVQANGNISAGSLTLGSVSGAIGGLNVTAGVSTFAGITTVTGPTLFSKQLSVSGVSTLGTTSVTNFTAQQINSTGISTISSAIIGSATTITGGGVNAVGVISATSYTTKGSGSYQIGGTDVITSGREIQKVVFKNYADKLYAFGNTGNAPTLDISNGNFVTATLTGNATFAFSLGTGVTSDAIQFTLHLTNDGTAGRTITWPASVRWPNGTVPTRTTTANRTDVYSFYTLNGGTDWYGILSIYNYS